MIKRATKRTKIEDVLSEDEMGCLAVCLVKLKQIDHRAITLKFQSATERYTVKAQMEIEVTIKRKKQ